MDMTYEYRKNLQHDIFAEFPRFLDIPNLVSFTISAKLHFLQRTLSLSKFYKTVLRSCIKQIKIILIIIYRLNVILKNNFLINLLVLKMSSLTTETKF